MHQPDDIFRLVSGYEVGAAVILLHARRSGNKAIASIQEKLSNLENLSTKDLLILKDSVDALINNSLNKHNISQEIAKNFNKQTGQQ